jgi:hypothetical protein
MVNLSYDPAMHMLVAYIGGSPIAAEHEQFIAGVDKLDRNGRDRNHAVGMVLILGPDAQAPNAYWRRRFAEQRNGMTAPRVFNSVVTTSAVLRGVLTAMNWISAPPPHVKTLHHATFEEASAWMELAHGAPQTVLRRLQNDVKPRTIKTA